MTEYKPRIYSEGVWVGNVSGRKPCVAMIRKLSSPCYIGDLITGDILDGGEVGGVVRATCGLDNDRKVGPWELTSWNDS